MTTPLQHNGYRRIKQMHHDDIYIHRSLAHRAKAVLGHAASEPPGMPLARCVTAEEAATALEAHASAAPGSFHNVVTPLPPSAFTSVAHVPAIPLSRLVTASGGILLSLMARSAISAGVHDSPTVFAVLETAGLRGFTEEALRRHVSELTLSLSIPVEQRGTVAAIVKSVLAFYPDCCIPPSA